MPKYVIERQYQLPVYAHDIIDAPDFATACRQSIDIDEWELAVEDYESAGATYLTRAVEIPEKWRATRGEVGSPATHALYSASLPMIEIPAEFSEDGAADGVAAPRLSDRELAAVLAGLRLYQMHTDMVGGGDPDLAAIASDGGAVEPLSLEETDALCERLNTIPKSEG